MVQVSRETGTVLCEARMVWNETFRVGYGLEVAAEREVLFPWVVGAGGRGGPLRIRTRGN